MNPHPGWGPRCAFIYTELAYHSRLYPVKSDGDLDVLPKYHWDQHRSEEIELKIRRDAAEKWEMGQR